MSYSRRQLIIATAGLAALAATSANAESANAQRRSSDMDMDIKRNGSRPSAKGSPDWFTGSVRVEPLFQARDPARVGGGQVTFEPGARTAWHTHPLGQTLIVTAGLGMGAARWRPRRRSPSGRCGLVSARLEALAWRVADDGDDTHRHSGIAERQERQLAGKGKRRAIPANLIPAEKPCPLLDHQITPRDANSSTKSTNGNEMKLGHRAS